jgi:hypothetical protein
MPIGKNLILGLIVMNRIGIYSSISVEHFNMTLCGPMTATQPVHLICIQRDGTFYGSGHRQTWAEQRSQQGYP